ncbi:MAG: thiamine phosphate synthase [Acidobacteria bacterium]|nr:thiamine phosphate synthase [Acidobacteriota bacterium]MBI3263924.1 thiamine phosphate synthase [Acidobacteriota bacterium]
MSRVSPLYAIADDDAARAAGWTLEALATEYLSAGARLLQIRSKRAGGGELLRIVEAVVTRARAAGADLVVNDRVDVMMIAGARGVHVGQTDLPPAAARALIGADPILGFSTHTRAQIDQAAHLPITYLAVGPIFETDTKDTGHPPVGLDLVRYARQVVAVPVVAIGGISLERAQAVLDAGADSVAVISDLLATGRPADRIAEYVTRLHV